MSTPNYDSLHGVEVFSVEDGTTHGVLSLCPNAPNRTCLLVFFTHFADLGSWEYAQALCKVLPQISASGVEVRCVGLGEVSGGKAFAEFTQLPVELLYADPSAACYEALGFDKGFGPELEISPYLKLLSMLLGVSSEGTISEVPPIHSAEVIECDCPVQVLRGYVGDRSRGQVFAGRTLFDILGRDYQRPFELATLRLDNSIKILSNWEALCPLDPTLLTQQGGTLVVEGKDVKFFHRDRGILMTPKMTDLLSALS